jgi:hypothetical protein
MITIQKRFKSYVLKTKIDIDYRICRNCGLPYVTDQGSNRIEKLCPICDDPETYDTVTIETGDYFSGHIYSRLHNGFTMLNDDSGSFTD